MRVLGLDIGSRSIDAVWLEDGCVVASAIRDTGYDPKAVCEELIGGGGHDVLVATGYGRHTAREELGAEIITEIKAYALGAHHLFPHARAILDIGGQDTKVISLSSTGAVTDFEMNDKCAAGTGKFLEVMARALGFPIDELGPAALQAESGVKVSSMCTVFAESEVTGLVHRGEDRGRIALGLCESIARRTVSSLTRVRATGPLVFAGGVAKNPAMVALVSAGYADEVHVPDQAQTVGALGAALHAYSVAEARTV